MNTLLLMRHVIAHPIDFYYEIQNPKRIFWFQGILLVALVFIVRMISILLTGYAFETREPYQISWIYELIWIVVPWIVYCISNWAVSAILEGEGKFKEIFVGSAFALVPYILLTIPVALLTNILSLDELDIIVTLTNISLVWTGWLLLVKIKVLHDFELGKLVWIALLSLLSMAIMLFVGILLFGLINQLIEFILDLIKEMRFRS
ncbi:YIP1 family protein [Paenibacillus solisilvae]|uniref:YIP1 family protein n=1 Tax=Paenibacillus solisilvae TaxID=2486751 RepID=A0ABW0W7W3_9BACL